MAGASGSCYYEAGRTKILCAVHGPKPITKSSIRAYRPEGLISCQIELLPGCREGPRISQQGVVCFNFLLQESDEALELASLLKQALEPAIKAGSFPNLQLDIVVSVIEDDGDVLSAAITAAGIAMLHSGLEMHDTVVGCSAAIHDNNAFLMDPTRREIGVGTISIGMLYHSELLSQARFIGSVDAPLLQEALNLLKDAAKTVYETVRQVVSEQILKPLVQQGSFVQTEEQ